jgi:hypothetical protein
LLVVRLVLYRLGRKNAQFLTLTMQFVDAVRMRLNVLCLLSEH